MANTANKYTIHPTVNIHQDAVVVKTACLEGDITIGAGTVVHPFATIRATSGPIVIGERNVIEETCLIENANPQEGHLMVIGNDNSIEVGSVIRAKAVGNNNSFQVKSIVGPETTISNGCSIGPLCEVFSHEVLPERTVVFGKCNTRRVAIDNPQAVRTDTIGTQLRTYHYLFKSSAAKESTA